jgi:hypothetical protein
MRVEGSCRGLTESTIPALAECEWSTSRSSRFILLEKKLSTNLLDVKGKQIRMRVEGSCRGLT